MPKISVYIPQDVYDAAKAKGLALPRICQQAIFAELGDESLSIPTILRRLAAWCGNFADDVEQREMVAIETIERHGLDPVAVLASLPMNPARVEELQARWRNAQPAVDG